MNFKPLLTPVFVCTLLAFFGLLFYAAKPAEESALVRIKADYHAELTATQKALAELARPDATADLVTLQTTFLQARLCYKKIEFLADYLDHQFINDFINGAPLPKLERKAPSLSPLDPKGFQILEEEIFTEQPDTAKIAKLSHDLHTRFEQFAAVQKKSYFSDRQVIEALRLGVVRIISLGLTGFDTPASGQTLDECATSWKALSRAASYYVAWGKRKDLSSADSVEEAFKKGEIFLEKNTDFDSFDCLYFIRACADPAFKFLGELQREIGIESYAEVSKINRPFQLTGQHIFATDLLNPYAFTELRKTQYENPTLRKLGRALFYDPALSVTNERACASCHQPEKGFTDGQQKSIALGFKGHVGRNAPTLINAVFAKRFFYDLRATTLEKQIEHVVFSEKEFGTDFQSLFEKLEKSKEYTALFREAFPQHHERPINRYTLSVALAAYVRSLASMNSPVDQYLRRESTALPENVKHGFNLFMGKATCGTCHFAPTFAGQVPPFFDDTESEILGVPADTLHPWKLDADPGRAAGTAKENAPFYKHSFKTTTVRNIALTAPYMHNGVFSNLRQVLEFYNHGGGQGHGLEVPYQTLPPDSLYLNETELQALEAFMLHLTDTAKLLGPPAVLPRFEDAKLDARKIGGEY